MPLVQYCKKCRKEVPLAEQCPYCGARLGKNSETLSFDTIHVPLKDWFCWNGWLRIALPVIAAVVALVVAAEFVAGGAAAALKLLRGNFLPLMLLALGAVLLAGLVLLRLQGGERIHYAMDKLGLHAWTYLEQPTALQLYARFMTPDMVRRLEGDERALLDLTLIRHQFIAWKNVSRTYFWKENGDLLIYRPHWWQQMTVHCPLEEMAAVEQMVNVHVKSKAKPRGKKPAAKRKKKA